VPPKMCLGRSIILYGAAGSMVWAHYGLIVINFNLPACCCVCVLASYLTPGLLNCSILYSTELTCARCGNLYS
jgi:hypothetical protein